MLVNSPTPEDSNPNAYATDSCQASRAGNSGAPARILVWCSGWRERSERTAGLKVDVESAIENKGDSVPRQRPGCSFYEAVHSGSFGCSFCGLSSFGWSPSTSPGGYLFDGLVDVCCFSARSLARSYARCGCSSAWCCLVARSVGLLVTRELLSPDLLERRSLASCGQLSNYAARQHARHRDRPPIHGGGLTFFLWNGAVSVIVVIRHSVRGNVTYYVDALASSMVSRLVIFVSERATEPGANPVRSGPVR